MMKSVEVYTDGACSGNPGAGGWAAILLYRGREKILAGGEAETTNNRMEIRAVLEGLRGLREPCAVTVYSDSAYTVGAFEKGWLGVWVKNGWRTSGKDEVKNRDLWEALLAETKRHSVRFVKVKGHADNEYNNRCDALARAEIGKIAKNPTENDV